jgi:hypothetical protein
VIFLGIPEWRIGEEKRRMEIGAPCHALRGVRVLGLNRPNPMMASSFFEIQKGHCSYSFYIQSFFIKRQLATSLKKKAIG